MEVEPPEPRSEESLLDSAKEAAELLINWGREKGPVRLISHVDTDGQCSGAVIAKALFRAGISFQARVVQQLDESSLSDATVGDPSCVVLTDLGSGSLELIERTLPNRSVLILDHHQVAANAATEGLKHVNPRLYGISGENELSASGVAYFVAKNMDARNTDLSPVGILGALGDLQDRNSERRLRGMNMAIVTDAVESGLLTTEVDLLIFGRETRPLHTALSSTTNPFLQGLSGEEDQCVALLAKLGIALREKDRWRVLGDLTQEEKKRLFNGIIAFIISRGFRASGSVGLVGTLYTLVKEDRLTPLRDGREFSSLVNACGRVGKPGLGLSILMGDRTRRTLDEASEVLADYRRTLAEGMRVLAGSPERVREFNALYWVNCEDAVSDRMVSSVLSLFSSSPTFSLPKALVATARMEDGRLKVSARGTETLVGKGLNLGVALAEASHRAGGTGGGHKIAAGAVIPADSRESFLNGVDELVTSQTGEGSLGSSSRQGQIPG